MGRDAGITIETVRLFGHGAVAVALQTTRCRGDDAVHEIATEFTARSGLIYRILRSDSGVDHALATAGLNVADALPL